MNKTDLILEIKEVILKALDLEDMTVDDIDPEAPLFGDGLGLDSIDALELGMALKKKYQVTFKTDKAENKKHFYSVHSLADYIADALNLKLE